MQLLEFIVEPSYTFVILHKWWFRSFGTTELGSFENIYWLREPTILHNIHIFSYQWEVHCKWVRGLLCLYMGFTGEGYGSET